MTGLDKINNIEDVKREMPGEYDRILGRLPADARYGFGTWVFFGVSIGGDFMNAVISNDLVEAFSRADSTNTAIMRTYTMWLYNDVPSGSWRKQNLAAWSEHGGLIGLMKQRAAEGDES